jgi:hypothetical protein
LSPHQKHVRAAIGEIDEAAWQPLADYRETGVAEIAEANGRRTRLRLAARWPWREAWLACNDRRLLMGVKLRSTAGPVVRCVRWRVVLCVALRWADTIERARTSDTTLEMGG